MRTCDSGRPLLRCVRPPSSQALVSLLMRFRVQNSEAILPMCPMQYHVRVNNACMDFTETLAKSDCVRPQRHPQENHVTLSTRCAHAETRGERKQLLRQCFRTRFKHHVPLRSVLCPEETDATKKNAFLIWRAICCKCATAPRDFTINDVPQCISA